ncbi:MAG: MarR family transcriptional regulator [Candidatus Bathyarchaeia archaeon]|jgi:MarR family transcriptional regulator for hemolysin
MGANTIQTSIGACGREVLDVVPLAMRAIRAQLRKHGAKEVSVPQFRTLAYLNRHEGTSLSDVAEHIGLTLPSMSALVDSIVMKGLVIRQTHPEDRRRMTLTLTERGRATLRVAHEAAASYLEEKIGQLSATERATVIEAMQVLKRIFRKAVD